jgi:ketosteroid isomerase-like protein
MAASDETDDVRAIEALIGAHFDGLRWSPGTRADWAKFTADFLPDASLFPAARPVRRQTLEAFVARMDGVAEGALRSFEEKTLGMRVLVFGNVAVVLAASEMLENGTEVNHDVSGYLLLKDEGKWRIAAHAWDHANEQRPVPDYLRHRGSGGP